MPKKRFEAVQTVVLLRQIVVLMSRREELKTRKREATRAACG